VDRAAHEGAALLKTIYRTFIWSLVAIMLGCATQPSGGPVNAIAPGAENVKITRNAADIASCTAVGNVSTAGGDAQLQNEGVGLHANVVLVTLWGVISGVVVTEGVAYRCGSAVAVQ